MRVVVGNLPNNGHLKEYTNLNGSTRNSANLNPYREINNRGAWDFAQQWELDKYIQTSMGSTKLCSYESVIVLQRLLVGCWVLLKS